MDRMEEYRLLQAELEQPPAALEYTVQRARARRRSRTGRRAAASLGSAAAAFALFVLLVNVSTPFALACSHIPVLKELAAAVSFSPTLSAAVEHDYVQTIGQTQSSNGITMTLNYVMLDRGQIILFLTADGPEGTTLLFPRPRFTLPDGSELQGCSVLSSSMAPGELSNAITVVLSEDFVFPEALRLECSMEADVSGGTTDAVFTFDVPLDRRYLDQSRSLPVDRWLELDGQRIHVTSLEIFPTFARLNLEQDPANTEVLRTMDFYLEDENGVRYADGSASGLSAQGDSYLCESPFFAAPEHLTLHITEVAWLEKGREWLTLDLERGEALSPLPDGVSVSIHRSGDAVGVALIAPAPPGCTDTYHRSYQITYQKYRSPDGVEHDINQFSTTVSSILWDGTEDLTPVPEGCFAESFTLWNCPWDTVDLAMYFSRRAVYETPAALDLT